MVNTFYPQSGLLNVDLSVNGNADAPEFALGQCVMGNDGTEWIYAQCATGSSIAAYDYVTIDENFTASTGSKTAVDDGHRIALAQWAFTTAQYGWFAIAGTGANVKVNVLVACALDVPLYTSGTDGKLDDASTSQTKIDGIVAYSSATATTTPVTVIARYMKSNTF